MKEVIRFQFCEKQPVAKFEAWQKGVLAMLDWLCNDNVAHFPLHTKLLFF